MYLIVNVFKLTIIVVYQSFKLKYRQIMSRHKDILDAKIADLEKDLEHKKISIELSVMTHQQMLEDLKVNTTLLSLLFLFKVKKINLLSTN